MTDQNWDIRAVSQFFFEVGISIVQAIKMIHDTCLENINSPRPTAYHVLISTALLVTLFFVHNGVRWRRNICAEAFPSIFDPSIGKALLLALTDAQSWSVVLFKH